uniref:DUF8018 domain-containing protein n=1 Tax=Ammopiptanthus mongolicus TaxID=126911 RepID=A0A4P8PFN1_AMMMO|nr:hypothetical protein [Ammopiptanthus mongolicus]
MLFFSVGQQPTSDFRLPELGEQARISLSFFGGAEQLKNEPKQMKKIIEMLNCFRRSKAKEEKDKRRSPYANEEVAKLSKEEMMDRIKDKDVVKAESEKKQEKGRDYEFKLKLGLALAMAILFAMRTILIGECQPFMMSSSEGPNQGWTDLLGSSERESSEDTLSSVNQQGARPAPAPNEAYPPVVPYPYQSNEIIGGDCVEAIQQRFLGGLVSPSAHDIQMARNQAEDQFEVKVDIVRVMAGLDPSGDWMGRGASALENTRTGTGEEYFCRLHQMLDDLQTAGLQSETFRLLVPG